MTPTNHNFSDMSDELLEKSIKSYVRLLAEAIIERDDRLKDKVDIAYDEFDKARDKLAELGIFKTLAMPFPPKIF